MVAALFDEAGLALSATDTRLGAVRFSSIDEFVAAEVESTPLIDLIDDDIYARIREESRDALRQFGATDSSTEMPIEGHLITAYKR